MNKMSETKKIKLEFLEELKLCVCYAGVRADGNINGQDLIDAINFRKEELKK